MIKNSAASDSKLYDYENVSEKCGKFVIWRLYKKFSRGSYAVYKVSPEVSEECIYPEFAHNAAEYYSIVNKVLKENVQNPVIVVLDSGFEESNYTDYNGKYAVNHDGYVERTHFYKAYFNTGSTSDTTADTLAANHRIAKLTTQYVSKKYAGYIAATTQELIDCVIKACEENRSSFYGDIYMFDATIAVKDNGAVNSDIEVIRKGLKAKYPTADIIIVFNGGSAKRLYGA